MRMLDFSNTQTPVAPTYEAPAAGAYPIGITAVEDHPGESYLDLFCDFIEGPFKGYYTRRRAEHPDWRDPLHFRKYYTPRALGFFKRFCAAVSRSNGNFVFDGAKVNCDERTLVGKRFGVVLQPVEYYTNSGDLAIRLEVLKEIPVDQVPYEQVPKILTIAKQEEIKARRAARQSTPAPAQAFAQQPAQPAQVAPVPAQAPAYTQQPAQTVARQTAATPAYTQPQAQQPAQQAYANPALAQFVDVSGDMEAMPFM